MPPVPFALNFYKHKSAPLSSQRVVNWFAEEAPADAKTPVILLQRPGLAPFAPTVGLGPMRGTHEMAGVLYAVSGANLFSVDRSGIATDLGMIGTNSTGLVSMADNGFELMVINDNDGWIFNKDTETLTKINDPDFPKVTAVTYLDGYFILTVLNSDQFIVSALRDGTSYDALDFATAEGDPDLLVTLIADKRQLFLFGTETIEPWYNSAEVFPFDRISGGYIETGLFARNSIAQVDNTIFWVGSDKTVVRLEGLTVAQRVSTSAIDQALAGFSNLGDARGFSLAFEGHAFYVLTIPEEATFAYDAATGLWHEWETYGQKAFNGCCHIQVYGHDLICDEKIGAIYIIDADTFDDIGIPIVRDAIGAPMYARGRRIAMPEFEAIFETGVGLTNGQGADPQAKLSFSDDGGRSWSNAVARSMGKIGEYQSRCIWRRLGKFIERTPRITVSDPVRASLMGANAEVRGEIRGQPANG